jgi:hypothetical protein
LTPGEIPVSKNRANQGEIHPCTDYSGRMPAVPGKNSGSRAISWDRRRHAGIPVGAPARSVDRIRAEGTGHDRPARVAPRPNIDSLVKEQTSLESARVNRRREERQLGNSEKS